MLFIDGLKRVLQTKKDATIFTGPDTAAQDVMIVSGRVTLRRRSAAPSSSSTRSPSR